jgi:hypothetical protein
VDLRRGLHEQLLERGVRAVARHQRRGRRDERHVVRRHVAGEVRDALR